MRITRIFVALATVDLAWSAFLYLRERARAIELGESPSWWDFPKWQETVE